MHILKHISFKIFDLYSPTILRNGYPVAEALEATHHL